MFVVGITLSVRLGPIQRLFYYAQNRLWTFDPLLEKGMLFEFV